MTTKNVEDVKPVNIHNTSQINSEPLAFLDQRLIVDAQRDNPLMDTHANHAHQDRSQAATASNNV
jgi:hypothetical protein